MKKFIIALSVLLLVAVVILKVSYAQDPQEVKKATTTETKKDTNCAAAKECPGMTAAKTGDAKECDQAKTADSKEKSEGSKSVTEAGATAEAKAEAKPCCAK